MEYSHSSVFWSSCLVLFMSDDIEVEIMLYFPTDCNDLGVLLPSLVVPLRFSKPPEHATSLLPHFLLPLQGIGDENWRRKRKTSWIKIRKIYSNSNSIDEVYKKGSIYTKTPQKLTAPNGFACQAYWTRRKPFSPHLAVT